MAGSKALLKKFDIYLVLKSYGHKFALKANFFIQIDGPFTQSYMVK